MFLFLILFTVITAVGSYTLCKRLRVHFNGQLAHSSTRRRRFGVPCDCTVFIEVVFEMMESTLISLAFSFLPHARSISNVSVNVQKSLFTFIPILFSVGLQSWKTLLPWKSGVELAFPRFSPQKGLHGVSALHVISKLFQYNYFSFYFQTVAM